MSRLPSSMMSGRRSTHQPTQSKIIDTNSIRNMRTIYWSCRWLDGIVGQSTRTLWGVDRLLPGGQPAEPQMHWALRIGSYLYELIMDENLNIQWRYVDETRAQAWKSAVPDRIVGETSATDTELVSLAQEAISQMGYSYTSPDSPKAKYNIIKNNCHTFALILLSDIMCFEIKTSCMTESDVFAGCKKMGLMSGVNNVSRMITKVSSSMNPYLPGGVLDIESNSWRGPYLSEQSHSRPDYQLGAVMKEKSKRQAAGLRY